MMLMSHFNDSPQWSFIMNFVVTFLQNELQTIRLNYRFNNRSAEPLPFQLSLEYTMTSIYLSISFLC